MMAQPPPPGGRHPGPPGLPGQAMGLNPQGASQPFFQTPPNATQMQTTPMPPSAPGAPVPAPGMQPPGMQPPGMGPPGMGPPGEAANTRGVFTENVDLSIQAPKRLFRTTTGYIPGTASMGSSSSVPIGGMLRPLAPPGPDEDDVDVVQPGAAGIIRCKR